MNKVILMMCIILLIILVIFFGFTADGRAAINEWVFGIKKADNVTNYETLKEVENTCRAMISSYEADKLTYEQYKDNDNEEKQSWGEQAKMRANKTATNYNNYILKNSFIWKDNVPADIYTELPVIE